MWPIKLNLIQVPQTIMSPYTPQYAHLLLQPQVFQSPAQSVSPVMASEGTKKIQIYVTNLSPSTKDAELSQLFQVQFLFEEKWKAIKVSQFVGPSTWARCYRKREIPISLTFWNKAL